MPSHNPRDIPGLDQAEIHLRGNPFQSAAVSPFPSNVTGKIVCRSFLFLCKASWETTFLADDIETAVPEESIGTPVRGCHRSNRRHSIFLPNQPSGMSYTNAVNSE